jgi:hypothetical protein
LDFKVRQILRALEGKTITKMNDEHKKLDAELQLTSELEAHMSI